MSVDLSSLIKMFLQYITGIVNRRVRKFEVQCDKAIYQDFIGK